MKSRSKGAAKPAKGGNAGGKHGKSHAAKPKGKKASKGRPARGKPKWQRDARNPFRAGSSYAACYDILAAHEGGLPKAKLVKSLAKATGKDIVRAGYDCQVVLSAKRNEDGLSNNDSPRHRSCRGGFWVKRMNGTVMLVVD